MSSNTIYIGFNNKVILSFAFSADSDFYADGLNTFDEVKLIIGGEEYSTIANPSNLYIDSDSLLILDIGAITSLDKGSYSMDLIGIDGASSFVLNCAPTGDLGRINVSDC